MPTRTYYGNLNEQTNGTAVLKVAAGTVKVGESIDFTAGELTALGAIFDLRTPTAWPRTDFPWTRTLEDDTPDIREVQTITVTATSGTFTVTFDGATTSALPFNVTAAALRTALIALSTIEDVDVTGGPGGTSPLVVSFKNPLGNVPAMTLGTGSLVGGTATVAQTTQGVS